jgi:cobalt/nickel transport system permease protein
LGGGILLAALLGPHAALIVMASVLAVQALMFADGGLLALGCNILNLGVIPVFVAYPLIYLPLSIWRKTALLLGCTGGLLLGALGVVMETSLSGISVLPAKTFLMAMLPIHAAIGLVEGLATAALFAFLTKSHPELLSFTPQRFSVRRIAWLFAGLALLCGGWFSWFASKRPDGLEWAIQRISGATEPPEQPSALHRSLASTQTRTALLPDYQLRGDNQLKRPVTSLAGLAGGATTLLFVACLGWLLRRRRK